MTTRRPFREGEGGQALVEFSLAIGVFLLLMLGIFDLGRGVYTYNGVSQAAREIARTTSVHPGTVLGQSSESLATIATQQHLVSGITSVVLTCVDALGTDTGASPCPSGSYVRVRVIATYRPVSLLGLGGPIQVDSISTIVIP